jgi:hypothetical protein
MSTEGGEDENSLVHVQDENEKLIMLKTSAKVNNSVPIQISSRKRLQ